MIIESGQRVEMIQFRPRAGDAFAAVIEAETPGGRISRNFDPRATVDNAIKLETNSVEQHPAVLELNGEGVEGRYFSVVDKRWANAGPPPGEYKFLSEGYARAGSVILHFRLVSNSRDDERQTAFLSLVETAKAAPK